MVDIESNGEFITFITSNPKIYKPKPKKIYISNISNKYAFKTKKSSKNKHKLTSTNNHNYKIKDDCLTMFQNTNENKYEKDNKQIDKISFQEMQNDFKKLKERKEKKENIKEQAELFYLLTKCLKTNFKGNHIRDTLIIKRPKKPSFENLD